MKRKITDLEQKLLDNGWKLKSKTYCGKHSQFTLHYEFRKSIQVDLVEQECVVLLDKHRNHIVFYGIDYRGMRTINKEISNLIVLTLDTLEKELENVKQ